MDFTISCYKELIASLSSNKSKILTVSELIQSYAQRNDESTITLRHDVDLLPHNALRMAQLEEDIGIRSTYYFRIVPESYNEQIIAEITRLGHEVGYHYEDVDLAWRVVNSRKNLIGSWKNECQRSEVRDQRSEFERTTYAKTSADRQKSVRMREPSQTKTHPPVADQNNNQQLSDLIERAMDSFISNLDKMRKIAEIKSICMHGSPLSPYDNRLLWTKYDYRYYGIIGEPYFDVDFSEVAYYTDTGRRWNGEGVSVRDKVIGDRSEVKGQRSDVRDQTSDVSSQYPATSTKKLATCNQQTATSTGFPKFRTTREMIRAIEQGRFPQKAMLTIHPQRWHDRAMPWVRELLWQNVKNVGKFLLVRVR